MKRWTLCLVSACAILPACVRDDATDPSARGSITITVNGLADGVEAAITVTGPSNYQADVRGNATLADLVPGAYTVDARTVTDGSGDLFTSDRIQHQIQVGASASVPVSVSYGLASGRMDLRITGLPTGSAPLVVVEGPDGFALQLTSGGVLTGLGVGSYVVLPQEVVTQDAIYTGAPPADTVAIAASPTPEVVDVAYELASGDLTVEVDGQTGGAAPILTVVGPNSFTTTIGSGDTIRGLRAGSYTISGDTVTDGEHTYAASAPVQADVHVGSETTAMVAYQQITGSLGVIVTGLPPSAEAEITVSGPNGYSTTVPASDTLHGLDPGSYSVDARDVADNGDAYEPTPETQTTSVSAAATAAAAVTYTNTGPIAFNLTIDGMYIVQSIQRYDGGVPLLAGRDGYLRIFGMANTINAEAPAIRVWWYDGATVLDSVTISAPGVGVPTSPNESQLASSWNLALPAAVISPTLRIRAQIDPDDDVTEADEADNGFPLDGQPAILDVRSPPPLDVRFVPVHQSVSQDTGGVDAGTVPDFLDRLERMFPLSSVDADVRATYTSDASTLQSDNGNNAWNVILSEMNALRTTDGSGRYYYGVVRVSYGSGVAGIGYVGGRAAVGWDYLPSGSGVMAHELGHNMNRRHAPCGNPGGVDLSYPYANASIGVWGMDVAATALKSPDQHRDLMSYCGPEWISDYTYEAILDWHAPTAAFAHQPRSQPGLLVWGRIAGDSIVLEPAFAVEAPPAAPGGSGPYRLEAVDALGRTVISAAFEGVEVADLPSGPERHFSFVIPWTATTQLSAIRVRGAGLESIREAPPGVAAAGATVARVDDRRAVVQWDASRYPMALVRDPTTGDVLSFARGGSSRVATRSQTLHITLSDGVRTVVVGPVRAR